MQWAVQNDQHNCAPVRLGFSLPPYQVHSLNFLWLHYIPKPSRISAQRSLFLGSINQLPFYHKRFCFVSGSVLLTSVIFILFSENHWKLNDAKLYYFNLQTC